MNDRRRIQVKSKNDQIIEIVEKLLKDLNNLRITIEKKDKQIL